MNNLEHQVREVINSAIPIPSAKNYAKRLKKLYEVGRTDLSLAKLAEAHWDAVAILAEHGRQAHPGVLYAVWAAEIPGKKLSLQKTNNSWTLSGTKMFCSGAGIVDRALVTVDNWLVDVDLKCALPEQFHISPDDWFTLAFKETQTSTIRFNEHPLAEQDILGNQGWYLKRAGFWQGALGPAACWGGGAARLHDYALLNSRKDAHTLAHLAAIDANVWAIQSLLDTAGKNIDSNSQDPMQTQILALKTRHLIEQLCTDTLRRFARAYGPFPLACERGISRHYSELDLFLRQNHAERDLENLGLLLKTELQ